MGFFFFSLPRRGVTIGWLPSLYHGNPYICFGYLNNVRPPKVMSRLEQDAPRLEQGFTETRWTARRVFRIPKLQSVTASESTEMPVSQPKLFLSLVVACDLSVFWLEM